MVYLLVFYGAVAKKIERLAVKKGMLWPPKLQWEIRPNQEYCLAPALHHPMQNNALLLRNQVGCLRDGVRGGRGSGLDGAF